MRKNKWGRRNTMRNSIKLTDKRIKISINLAKPGMRTAEHIYTATNLLIVPKNCVLTAKAIDLIKNYMIQEIYIEREDEQQLAQKKEYMEDERLEKIKKTVEFKKFEKEFSNSTASIKASINNVVAQNKEIAVDELLNSVDNVLKKSQNGYHVFDLLQCIRDMDDQTYVHSLNVAMICNVLGHWLNFSQEDLKTITMCGLLHDIGKLAVPLEILTKPSRLSSDEYEKIQEHTIEGYNLLKKRKIDTRIKQAALLHHEACDGSGYPYAFQKEQIPIFARIVTIADVYDAMTANRVYRGPMCPFAVIENLEEGKYNKYDPNYLLPFLNRIAESYINSTVRLSNNEKGVVIMNNKDALSRPIIQVDKGFIDLSKRKDIRIEKIL